MIENDFRQRFQAWQIHWNAQIKGILELVQLSSDNCIIWISPLSSLADLAVPCRISITPRPVSVYQQLSSLLDNKQMFQQLCILTRTFSRRWLRKALPLRIHRSVVRCNSTNSYENIQPLSSAWKNSPSKKQAGKQWRTTFLRSVLRLLVTANVNSSPIFVTLMMEAIRSSEMSVLTRAKWRNIPEDGILHSHRRENLNLTSLCVHFVLSRVHIEPLCRGDPRPKSNKWAGELRLVFEAKTPAFERAKTVHALYMVSYLLVRSRKILFHTNMLTGNMWCDVRSAVFTAVTEEWRPLGCYAVRLL
jgi:hypothetical protein